MAVAHPDATVDDGERGVGVASRQQERGERVEDRPGQRKPPKRKGGDVGGPARGKLTDIVATERAGAAASRHPEDVLRGKPPLGGLAVVVTADAVQQHREAQLVEHVAGVAARRAVDTDADIDAMRAPMPEAGGFLAEANDAVRAVRDAGAGVGDSAHLLVVEQRGVGEPGALPQPARFAQEVNRLAPPRAHELVLVRTRIEMHMQAAAVLVSQVRKAPHELGLRYVVLVGPIATWSIEPGEVS